MYHLTIVFKVTLCASCNKRIFSMSSVQEMQRVDRELFLELIESPVNPTFLHMSGKNDLREIKELKEAKQSTSSSAGLKEIIFDFR